MNWEEAQKAWAILVVHRDTNAKVAKITDVHFEIISEETYQLGEYTWDTTPASFAVEIRFDAVGSGPGSLDLSFSEFSDLLGEIVSVASTGALPA